MEREVINCIREMSRSSRLGRMAEFCQHGDTNCLAHTVAVVYCALRIADRLHIDVNRRELIRGGILHDYFSVALLPIDEHGIMSHYYIFLCFVPHCFHQYDKKTCSCL